MGRELHGCNGGAIGATDDTGGVRAVSRRGNDFTYVLYALSFDGTNDYVDSSSVPSTSGFTLEFWVKLDVDELRGIVTTTNGTHGLRCITYQSGFQIRLYDNGFSYPVEAGSFTVGSFSHVAVTFDGSTVTLYVDGTNVGSTSASMSNSPSGLQLGKYYEDGSGSNLKGDLSDIRLWNYTRTQTEIQTNANSTLTGNETGLVNYYPTNLGSGTTLVDNAGTNDGTITGATWVERGAFPQI